MARFFSSDLALKIFSVLAAVIMWMYVMNEQNPQVTYVVRDVPVKLENLDTSKFALVDESRKYTVNVKIKGRRSLITNIKPQDIEAEVNLRGRIEGENLLPVSVSVPGNVELLDFSPKEIMVSLDSIIEEQMQVSVDVKGTPADGFEWVKPIAKPQAVVLKGPRSRVDAAKVVTAQVDISGKDSSVVSTLPLRVLDSQGKEQKDVSFRPEVVEVTVPIVPVSSVSIKPNIKGAPLEGYIVKDVEIDPSIVTVTAPKDALKQLQSISTDSLNIQGYTHTVTKQVNLVVPRGVKILEDHAINDATKAVKITVEIEKAASRTLTFTPDMINLKNLSPELEAAVENKDIVLTVAGPKSIIDRVNENVINIYMDAAGLLEGEHHLKIKAEAPDPFIIQKIEPDSIKVTLRRL
ncbi:MAG: hypothetical protein PWQ97_1179 [Tepidanaerobacteraceae bacterium]|nr:hypothetical protein [Tepidanaerobacteraceae bacterium]